MPGSRQVKTRPDSYILIHTVFQHWFISILIHSVSWLWVKVFVSVIGDILGAAVLNVDELIEMPMGCGEQNVARLFPNVLIYDYLSRFKPGLPLVLVRISVWVCLSGVRWALSKDPIDMDVRLNLLNNIRDGYKRHVGNFLNVDGSFSVFKWATTG